MWQSIVIFEFNCSIFIIKFESLTIYMTPTSEEIKKQIEELTRLQRIDNHLQELYKTMEKNLNEKNYLTELLNNKQFDVEKLEKMNVRNLFYTVLGSKEEQIEKERQEYLEIALKIKDLIKQIELDTFEIEVLRKQLTNTEIIETRIKELKKLREKEISSNPEEENHRLLRSLFKDQEENSRLKVEIDEAYNAGYKAIISVEKLYEQIGNARNWGQWHLANRKTIMDSVLSQSHTVNHLLTQFEIELRDIGVSRKDLYLDLNFVQSWIHLLAEALIQDWLFEQRIKKSIENVANLHKRMKELLDWLLASRNATVQKLSETQNKIDHVVQNSI